MTPKARALCCLFTTVLLVGGMAFGTREVAVPGGVPVTLAPEAEGVPVAYQVAVYRPDGSLAASRTCGTLPTWPPAEPWPHPPPGVCALTVTPDRPGYWRVTLATYYRHENPAGTCWATGDLLVVWVDDGPVFHDGFEGGDLGAWSHHAP